MRYMLSICIVLACAAVSQAEDPSILVWVDSDPPHAELVFTATSGQQNARAVKSSTSILPWQMKMPMEQACRAPRGTIVVRWVSGAEVALPPDYVLCLSNGPTQRVIVQRPTGIPGAEIDAAFAAQVDQLVFFGEPSASAARRRLVAKQQPARERARATIQQSGIACHSRVQNDTVLTACSVGDRH